MALLVAAVSLAAEPAAQHGEAAETHAADHTTRWKVANFILLAGGLGYFIRKKGGPFFQARTQQIQRDIAEAARVKAEAEARATAIEERLAGLEAEIEELRRSARQESVAEGERVRARVRENLAKIQAQAEREIASAVRAARQELRRFAAERAIELAGERVRAQMSGEVEDALAAVAIQELGRAREARPDQGRPV
jgi:F-type H+-transporting ATPase subunit b